MQLACLRQHPSSNRLVNLEYDAVVTLALALPDAEESTSYGTPSVKRKGKFMFRLKEDGTAIAVKLAWDVHDRLLQEFPAVFFKTPHYDGYPALLARLDALTPEVASQLVTASWEDAPKPAKKG